MCEGEIYSAACQGDRGRQMIWNIVDRRERCYRWKRVNAIIEPTSHDNCCQDSDQAEEDPDAAVYEQREGISLTKAVAWADAKPYRVTLYLYDEGCGTT
jgi:hypothetical protein